MTPWRWAIQHLYHRTRRTLTALAGIAFVSLLLFVEMGFLRGVDRTASLLFDQLRFDLLMTSSEYEDLSRTTVFPRCRLAQAHAAAGVEAVIPLSLGFADWRLPTPQSWFGSTSAGAVSSIAVLALPPEWLPQAFACGPDGVFADRDHAQQAATWLARRHYFLFDQCSKPEYGSATYWMEQSLTPSPIDPPVLNDQRAWIAGSFRLGTGFCWNALLLTADTTLGDYLPLPADAIHFGLIQLRPGSDPLHVQAQLQTVLPPDVRIWTREQIIASERRYWVQLTSVGQFLTVAVALVVLVGIICVYQMMAADVRSMWSEYATVKAIGHRPRFATTMVLCQATLLGIGGWLPSYAAATVLYRLSFDYGGIPAEITPLILITTATLTIGICWFSGLLALRHVHASDPADLF
jgi:putative ABC transport system permease protein